MGKSRLQKNFFFKHCAEVGTKYPIPLYCTKPVHHSATRVAKCRPYSLEVIQGNMTFCGQQLRLHTLTPSAAALTHSHFCDQLYIHRRGAQTQTQTQNNKPLVIMIAAKRETSKALQTHTYKKKKKRTRTHTRSQDRLTQQHVFRCGLLLVLLHDCICEYVYGQLCM